MTAAAPLGVVTFLFTDIEGSTRPGPSGFRGRWTGWRLHRPTSVGIRDLMLLRLRALLAQTRGATARY